MKKYFLILTTLLVSFVVSNYAGDHIFVANTPQSNKNYLADLQNQFKKSINSIYLAFSFKSKKPIKKDIAVSYPTLKSFPTARPITVDPNSRLTPVLTVTTKPVLAIDPATIPANLFKPITKGISAYEGEDTTVFKFEKGAEYKVRTIEVDGKKFEVIDLTSQ